MMFLAKAEHHAATLRGLRSLLTQHRELLWAMSKRELAQRYAGQLLGVLWAIGHPLIRMAVYVVVFAFVFKVRLPGEASSTGAYTVYILVGLIPWLAFQEAMVRGSTAVAANSNLVTQVVFPVEVLPLRGVVVAAITEVISLALLLGYLATVPGVSLALSPLVPLLVAVQIFFMAGVALGVSAIGVFFRDVREIVQVAALVGIYLLPIFYVPDMVPAVFEPLLWANPLSYMVWCFQDAAFYGDIVHPWAWLVFPVVSAVTFYLGYVVFNALRAEFGSYL